MGKNNDIPLRIVRNTWNTTDKRWPSVSLSSFRLAFGDKSFLVTLYVEFYSCGINTFRFIIL